MIFRSAGVVRYFISHCIGLLRPTSVDVGVLLHIGLLVEALVTERTGERSDVTVNQ